MAAQTEWDLWFSGKELLTKDGDRVPCSSLLGKYVGVYFSAHWCPPCRGFTPKLAGFYNTLKSQGKNFEIVFVSSDKNQSSFDDYYGTMPWMALPYEFREEKEKFSSEMGVNGIPFLALFDEQGNLYSREGRAVISDLNAFPWADTPLPLSEVLWESLDGNVVDKQGETVAVQELQGKNLGIYFSAHWCPPCRMFTPALITMYNNVVAEKNLEIVFVSLDREESAFNDYYGTMPWKALKYDAEDAKNALIKQFDLEGIPMLVIVDENGELVTKDAVKEVRNDANAENFPWSSDPQPVNDVDENAEGIDSNKSIVFLMKGLPAEQVQEITEMVSEFALAQLELTKEISRNLLPKPCIKVFTATKEQGRLSLRITGLMQNNPNNKMVMLDIPNGGFYGPRDLPANMDDVAAFINDCESGNCSLSRLR